MASSRRLRIAPLLVGLLLSGLPVAASAAPVTYNLTGGTANITVMVNGLVIGSAISPTLTGSVTLDAVTPSIDAIDVTLASNILLNLSTPYGGYDQITIETASVVDAAGYGPTAAPVATGTGSYTTFAGPLDVSGSWGATDSTGTAIPATVSGIAIAYQMSQMTAVVGPGPNVSITGVTLHSLSGAAYGEASDLTVVAVLNLFATPVPEPSSGLLAAWGLALLAGARRRRS
ncbi:MAG: hypothetical protein OSB70_04675 [Myxococcota bacterium]|nr:hypothetical protein [Myxococcota bacterium]